MPTIESKNLGATIIVSYSGFSSLDKLIHPLYEPMAKFYLCIVSGLVQRQADDDRVKVFSLVQVVHGKVGDVDGQESPDVEAECGHGEELSVVAADLEVVLPGGNCIKIGLPGKLILSKRKGLWEITFS